MQDQRVPYITIGIPEANAVIKISVMCYSGTDYTARKKKKETCTFFLKNKIYKGQSKSKIFN